MNEITAITPQIKDKRRCNIYVDGRFCCGLTLETAVKNRLKVGQIISLERLAEIQLECEKNVAFDKALTHISATQKTEREIRTFLTGKGYLSEVVDYVIEKPPFTGKSMPVIYSFSSKNTTARATSSA